MRDTKGREYIKFDKALSGVKVEIDAGFTCAKSGQYTLQCDEVSGLPYFPCCEGRHYLAGQVEKGYLIGIYPA